MKCSKHKPAKYGWPGLRAIWLIAHKRSRMFKLARAERDAWLNWPSRVSAQMAAALQVDPHVLHVALDRAIRDHLNEMADIKVRID